MSEPKLKIAELNQVMGFNLSTEQIEIATAPLEPNVIVAGAGTGKTTVMAARVVWLVANGFVRPEEVLGLTFTRKAAGELNERIAKYLRALGVQAGYDASNADDVRVSTYDSFAGQLVDEFGLRIGVDSGARLITAVQSQQLATQVVMEYEGSLPNLASLAASTVASQLMKLESDLQSHLCSIERLEDFQLRTAIDLATLAKPSEAAKKLTTTLAERAELIELVKIYRGRKADLGLLEFADQMALAARLATEVPEVGAVLRERFRVVLLDEYQDTSSAQALLLRSLFSGVAGAGLGHPVTAVGDPFQAIYGWRGAAAANIEQFHAAFQTVNNTPARSYPLTVNRRSGTRILDVANDVASPLRSGAYDVGSGSLVAPTGSPQGVVKVGVFRTAADELNYLVDEVLTVHSEGRASSWREIAVLVRRNLDVPDIFAGLRDRDVPVEIVGLGGLLHLPEIADVVHTIRICLNSAANYSTSALLVSARWGVTPETLARLTAYAHSSTGGRNQPAPELSERLADLYAVVDPVDNPSLLEAIQRLGSLPPGHPDRAPFAPETLSLLQEFGAEISALANQTMLAPVDFCYAVIDKQGLLEELAADPTSRGLRVSQVHHFLRIAQEFVDLPGTTSLHGFLAYLDTAMNVEDGMELANPSQEDSVKILTVHRAKGLEMEVVFLPNLSQGVFPSERLTDFWVRNRAVIPAPLRGDADAIPQLVGFEKAQLDKYEDDSKTVGRLSEDRLGYVAFTRAKHTLIGTSHVWEPALVKPRKPSDYLACLMNAVDKSEWISDVVAEEGEQNPCPRVPQAHDWPAKQDPERLELRNEAIRTIRSVLEPELPIVGTDEEAKHGVSTEELGSEESNQLNHCGQEVVGCTQSPDLDQSTTTTDHGLSSEDAQQVELWHQRAAALIAEELTNRSRGVFTPPDSLSTSALISATKNPDRFQHDLRRPMPRRVSDSVLLGTRFHEWIEQKFETARFTEPLSEDFPMASFEQNPDEDLARLVKMFENGPYSDLIPDAVEVPFVLALGDRQIRGRIDAVYRLPGSVDRFQVVDWKTGRTDPDPLQLSCYRLAWANAKGISIDQVDAVFYRLTSGEVSRPAQLLDQDELLAVVEQLEALFGTEIN